MTFDAGEIRAKATLDKKPFIRSLTELRADARKGIDVKVDADTGTGDAKVLAFKRSLAGVGTGTTTAKVRADTAAAEAKLVPLSARLTEMGKTVKARIDVTGDLRARQQLQALDISLRALGQRVSRPRVSLAGAESAEIALDRLELRLARIGAMSSAAGGGRGGFFSRLGALGSHAPRALPLAVGAGLPLAGPLAGVAAGGLASFLTPTLAGGLGGGLFAKVASSTYKTLGADIKNLTTLQQRYNAATTDKSRVAALQAEKKAWAALSPAEQDAVDNQRKLSGEWESFQRKLQPQSFKLLATGTDIANKGLRLLLPTVRASGNAINDLATSADHSLSQPFWRSFFHDFLPGEAHRSLTTFGTDLGHGVTGIANLMEKFAPLGHRLEADSMRWSKQFENWTQGQGPGRFVDWVEKEGPIAAHALEGIAHGVEGVAKGLAPIGQVELKALAPTLNFIGKIGDEHPAIFTALGAGLLSIAAGLKAIALVKGVTGVLGAIGRLGGGGGGGIGVPIGGRGTGGTVLRDAESAGEGAAGATAGRTLLGRVLGRIGVSSVGDAVKLGARTGAADVFILPLATKIATAGTPDGHAPMGGGIFDTAGSFGRAGYGSLPASFVKSFPAVAALRSTLFTHTNRRTYSPDWQTNLDRTGGNTPSGYDLRKLVGNVVHTNDPHELATLTQLAKVYPQVAAALKPYVSGLTLAQQKSLRVADATKALGVAEGNMATIAQQTGGKLRGQSTAAEANRQALRGAAAQVKTFGSGLVAMGASQTSADRQTLAWAKSLRQNAIELYGNKSKVDDLLGSMHLLPRQIHTRIKADTEQAHRDLEVLKQQITTLPDGHVRIYTTTKGGQHYSGQYSPGIGGRGSGNTVHPASGGFIRGVGTGTSDSIPAMLSNGEFVINAKSTSRHLHLLHAINARRFSGGGQVFNPGGQHPSPNAPTSSSGSSGGSTGTSGGGSKSSAPKGPSKLAIGNAIASIASFAGLTFASDLQGTAHQVRSGIGQMIDRLNAAVRNHYLAGDKHLVDALKKARAPLANLADEEDAVTKRLAAAQQRLSTLRGSAASVRSGTVGSFLGLGDLTQASQTTSVRGLLSVDGQQVKVARAFKRNLAHLRKLGLSKDEYDALQRQGPAAAGQVVGLLATSSVGQIHRFNRNEGILRRLGQSTGTASADYLYKAKIGDATREVADFRADRREIIRHEKRTADAVEALVKGGLQDHGTHQLLQDVKDSIRRTNDLLATLANAPHNAATNARAHVPGAGVNRRG